MFDEEHGLDGPTCQKCGMVNCVGARGCLKRQRERRHRDELDSLRAEVARLRARETKAEALARAMGSLLDRIRSEPTMGGHLRAMHLRPDAGVVHATSDAIRGAKAALAEWEKP